LSGKGNVAAIQSPDRLTAADQAIEAYGDDAPDAFKALIVMTQFLEAQAEELQADVCKG
jgi:hypothetical protein